MFIPIHNPHHSSKPLESTSPFVSLRSDSTMADFFESAWELATQMDHNGFQDNSSGKRSDPSASTAIPRSNSQSAPLSDPVSPPLLPVDRPKLSKTQRQFRTSKRPPIIMVNDSSAIDNKPASGTSRKNGLWITDNPANGHQTVRFEGYLTPPATATFLPYQNDIFGKPPVVQPGIPSDITYNSLGFNAD